ncbi:MAG: hypothetical protein KJN93_09895, partial [Alphaproteobacteria bacterium]|nr:hypothetical protein [Alphaproteobacteria bacterium]
MRISDRRWPLVGFALIAIFGAVVINAPGMFAVLLSGGVEVLAMVVAANTILWLRRRADCRVLEAVAGFIEQETVAAFVTDTEGRLLRHNSAAGDAFRLRDQPTIGAVLSTRIADPAATLYRLQSRASKSVSVSEDVVTRAGHLRISVQVLSEKTMLWRVEDRQEATDEGGEASRVPLISIGRNGIVLYMNDLARNLVGGRLRRLDDLVDDPP